MCIRDGYGMLFDEMAQACEDEEEITADVFAEMITASVELSLIHI